MTTTLSAGARVGAYEITGLLGIGGMGEVYKAHDATLQRDVAIKVLPSVFTSDPERLARFRREARTLAALNHPNIASIYGLEDAGMPALVMELVDGPTLADRISRGPIPLDEALPIAQQMAEALEYAHERGIVHRDLKPANIKLGEHDAVTILDFGLAKALQTDPSSPDLASAQTSPHTTREGALLGTAAYMSPEQAKGKPVDRRTDIWAFGCVLYEMLSGDLAFHGEVVADTLAAVIRGEPDWSRLPATTPGSVHALLRRCLQKDSRQRLQAIGDARIVLSEVGSEDKTSSAPSAAPARGWVSRLGWALVGAVAAISATGLAAWYLEAPASLPPRPVTRFTITLPPGQQVATNVRALALSPDGTQLAYAATQGDGAEQLFLWAMDRAEARPIAGTDGGSTPFFSPDNQWLGFAADGKLKKVAVRGGAPQSLADTGFTLAGASWGDAHTIAFAPYSSVIEEVSDQGGETRPLTRFAPGETLHTWPVFLPGDKAVLFAAVTASPSEIAVQPIDGGQRRDLLHGQGDYPAYAPSGHLVYTDGGALMAAPFDLEHLKVDGVGTPVLDGVAQYSLSASGSLVYFSGGAGSAARQSTLVWVSRDTGAEQPIAAPPHFYNQPRLSPDGRQVAVDIVDDVQEMQVWLYDLDRDTLTPLTFEGHVNRHAVWSPDGKRIAFASNREGPTQVFSKLTDGSGGLRRLTNNSLSSNDVLDVPYSWSPDGKLLTFVKLAPKPISEFWVVPVADADSGQNAKERPFPVQTPALDGGPQISPNGRWLAYASQEPGHEREIYVVAFPGPGGKWQVSTGGGNEPMWNPNGRELFYRKGGAMMAVDIDETSGFSASKPHTLFTGNYRITSQSYVRPNYDVSPDGQRFLMLKPVETKQAPVTQINVVLNWSEELKRLVPTE